MGICRLGVLAGRVQGSGSQQRLALVWAVLALDLISLGKFDTTLLGSDVARIRLGLGGPGLSLQSGFKPDVAVKLKVLQGQGQEDELPPWAKVSNSYGATDSVDE